MLAAGIKPGNSSKRDNHKEEFLRNIPDTDLEAYYKYQFYLQCVQDASAEWDTLAILPKYNIIINIEVKRGAKFSKLQDATNQTQERFSLFKKFFGSSLKEQWNFVKAACVPNLKSEEGICDHCKFYLLEEKSLNNMTTWIKNLLRRVPKIKVNNSSQDYEDLLVVILGYQSLRNLSQIEAKIIDPEKLKLDTEKKITSGNPGITGENDADSQQLKRSL